MAEKMNRRSIQLIALFLTLSPLIGLAETGCSDLLQSEATPIDGGSPVDFCSAYRGKVILAVNTASQCGYSGQFKGLETLYRKYKDRGLVVLAFPSNDFHQEFDSAKQTAEVARVKYGVSFPIFEKSIISGDAANPFFKKLILVSGTSPKWNFQKFLIDRNGVFVKSYPSNVDPDDPLFQLELEALLNKQ